jgi:hypothetical protein
VSRQDHYRSNRHENTQKTGNFGRMIRQFMLQ